eukprot:scaffold6813_cov123-Isochrysis_galbana.AAC.3
MTACLSSFSDIRMCLATSGTPGPPTLSTITAMVAAASAKSWLPPRLRLVTDVTIRCAIAAVDEDEVKLATIMVA